MISSAAERAAFAHGQALAFVYCEEDPGRRTTAKQPTRDQARRIAANIAQLPELLRRLPIKIKWQRLAVIDHRPVISVRRPQDQEAIGIERAVEHGGLAIATSNQFTATDPRDGVAHLFNAAVLIGFLVFDVDCGH